jgi:hypothetical protein
MSSSRIGSTLDSMFAETGELEEVNLRAQKKDLAHAVRGQMDLLGMTKSALAVRMRTSRTVVDRLLDPGDTSVTLGTLARASAALGCRLTIGLVRARSERVGAARGRGTIGRGR